MGGQWGNGRGQQPRQQPQWNNNWGNWQDGQANAEAACAVQQWRETVYPILNRSGLLPGATGRADPGRAKTSLQAHLDQYGDQTPYKRVANQLIAMADELTEQTLGSTVRQAVEKTDQSIELIDMRTLSPFDMQAVEDSVKKTGRCVIVHEAPKTCGFGAELAARIMERCFLHLEAPVQRVAGFDTTMPYYKLEMDYLPDTERIGKAIAEVAVY